MDTAESQGVTQPGKVDRPARGVQRARRQLTVSVIVPVGDGGKVFARCLESLRALDPAPAEVVVVASGGDGSDALAGWLGCRVVRTARRSGPAAARNLGARAARGDLLFFVAADVQVEPGAVRRILRAFRDHPETAALLGSADDEPAAPGFFSQYTNLAHHYAHRFAGEGGTLWGGCAVVRRDVFRRLGGFDERYRRAGVEDVELGYRLQADGYRVRRCQELRVKHLKHWTAGALVQADFRRALPGADLVLRAGRFVDALTASPAGRAKVVVAYLLAAAAAAGWWPPAALLAGLLLALDARLLWFFCRKRGPWFALRTVPWQWFSYATSGLAFALGLAKFLVRWGRW